MKNPLAYAKELISYSRPVNLLFSSMAYFLGAGISRYLGYPIRWTLLLLGLIVILALQAMASFLIVLFRFPFLPLGTDETQRERSIKKTLLNRTVLILLFLAGMIYFPIFFMESTRLTPAIILSLLVISILIYAVPPISIEKRGYGELIIAVNLAVLIPGVAYTLQSSIFSLILPLFTFPLYLLSLEYYLSEGFLTFAEDQKFGRHSLLIRLTWRRAVPVMEILLSTAFIIYGFLPIAGIGWRLIWPAFLGLPLVLAKIILVYRLVNGANPGWKLYKLVIIGTFFITTYLMTLPLWIN